MALELEFTVEPFEPGRPGPHVRAAEEAATQVCGEMAIGPFGTLVSGEANEVMKTLPDVVRRALEAGATRVTLQVRKVDTGPGSPRRSRGAGPGGSEAMASGSEDDREAWLSEIRPVIEALGAEVLPAGQAGALDIPLVHRGEVVSAIRPAGLHDAFDRLLERVSVQLGAPLGELCREDKQRAVQLLEESGAFNFRKSVEDAARALRVSRFTVYNYLGRAPGEGRPRPSGAGSVRGT